MKEQEPADMVTEAARDILFIQLNPLSGVGKGSFKQVNEAFKRMGKRIEAVAMAGESPAEFLDQVFTRAEEIVEKK